jgi:16S rRNA processing protein RimM
VLTDRPEEAFRAGAALYREGTAQRLVVHGAAEIPDGPGWRVVFEDIPDRTAAESLRGAYLEAVMGPPAGAAAGDVFWHEVVGVPVLDPEGRELGRVIEVYRAGAADVYSVAGGDVGPFELPAVKSVIREFAPRSGRIVVDLDALALDATPVYEPRPAAPRRRHRWSRHGKGGAGAGGESGGGPADPSPPST